MRHRVLMIDNYDSFTYNLVQALAAMGAEVVVRYSDDITPAEVLRLGPTHLVVSPGPGRPEAAGASMSVIESAAGEIPILGVCLGHQAIAAVFGARIISAGRLMHGKSSRVTHDSQTVFSGLANPFDAGRYHSLAIDPDRLPADLDVSARSEDGEIMGIRHRGLDVEGVQFHPESVLTPTGDLLLGNFLGMAATERQRSAEAVLK